MLLENKTIYENYYLKNNRELWNKFENVILSNNRKLKGLFSANLDLFQHHDNKAYSNLALIQSFMTHVDEFEATRIDEEKSRGVLFPVKINSMFGIAPVEDFLLPSTESLESLIENLKLDDKFETIVMGVDQPYIRMIENGESVQVFLDDTPRLRQLYYNYSCFKSAKVRLDSLNFALKYIHSRGINYSFFNDSNLREIEIQNAKLIFVYEYCLSSSFLMQLSPEENCIIVNLHNWNGEGCISDQAYELAESMNVKLLNMEKFYVYINKIKHGHY